MYVAFTSHIRTTFHYTNNTMACNMQQNITLQVFLYFSTLKLGVFIVNIGPDLWFGRKYFFFEI